MKSRQPQALASAASAPRGFTLLELLMVIAILALAMALIVPAIEPLFRSSGLSQAADQVTSTLSLARQTAIVRNRPVEVRLYRYADAGEQPPGRFHGLQAFVIESNPDIKIATALGRKQTLPATVCISAAEELSSLMNPSLASQVSGNDLMQRIPTIDLNYTAVCFRFLPDGSTNLPSTSKAFLTLVSSAVPDTSTTPPPNFATLLIQPSNGKVKLLRP